MINQNIKYKYSYILKKRQYDFILLDYNIIIEADGDYWHGNPRSYKNLSDRQLMKQKDDIIKNKIAIDSGYHILRFWEYDINFNIDKVKNIIQTKINEKNL